MSISACRQRNAIDFTPLRYYAARVTSYRNPRNVYALQRVTYNADTFVRENPRDSQDDGTSLAIAGEITVESARRGRRSTR